MSMPVELDPHAEAEARDAFLWYLERNARAALAFESELDFAIQQISDSPSTYPIIEDDLRRFTLRRFPYSILYTIGSVSVRILAIAHQHRRPGYWRAR